ncbi:helix-turn-helix domain-containing protein [Pseudodesulfovibrio sediminis]|uniref:HTH cro/C1-type domain-containing protein n=1 Tax=Pseudodesulfovibrio sediminis TaxID=2810563 RepID=A0ABN6ENL6_9BACT|nr:helix-turn-helix transcriptional regulator [Pseudodesulfovibrio sediminis]BCS86840.1 hypothetical protein PSDVSF_00820 [Pseudodesulfovibrio sediminis]
MQSKVKEVMTEKGATILGLADDAGVSQRTIQKARDTRIESCTLRTLAAIATALGCRVKDLFEE